MQNTHEYPDELDREYIRKLFSQRMEGEDLYLENIDDSLEIGDECVQIGHYGRYEYDNEITYYVGCDNVYPPQYDIMPDYSGLQDICDWVDRWGKGVKEDFPDDPVLEPVIPRGKYEKVSQTTSLIEQKLIIRTESTVLDPTFRQVAYCQDKGMKMIAQEEKHKGVPVLGILADLEPTKQVYFKLEPSLTLLATKHLIVGMVFNPLHPSAAAFIEDIKQENQVITGTYIMRGAKKSFRYDLKACVYRVHSERWMPYLRIPSKLIQPEHLVYDIISNFDIIPYFREKHKWQPLIDIPPLLVMPINPPRLRRIKKNRNANRKQWEQGRLDDVSVSEFYSPLTNLMLLKQPVVENLIGDVEDYVLPYSSYVYKTRPIQEFKAIEVIPTDVTRDFVEISGTQYPLSPTGFPIAEDVYRRGDRFYQTYPNEGEMLGKRGYECAKTYILYTNAPRSQAMSLVQTQMTLNLIDYVRMVQLKRAWDYPWAYGFNTIQFRENVTMIADDYKLDDPYEIDF